jgi:hypothetical protein
VNESWGQVTLILAIVVLFVPLEAEPIAFTLAGRGVLSTRGPLHSSPYSPSVTVRLCAPVCRVLGGSDQPDPEKGSPQGD